MIAVATGNSTLDRQVSLKLKKAGNKTKIVKLKDDFLTEIFDTAIITKNLEGELGIEQLLYYLKENQCRVVYLMELSNTTEIFMCFKYDIYDIVIGPTIEKILDALSNEKSLSDWSKFLNSETGINMEQQLHELQEIREKERKRFEDEIRDLKRRLEEEKNKEPVVVEKKVEVPIEVPVIVEKTIEKKIEIIKNSNIVLISNCSSGKSFLTWNIAYEFSKRDYNTTVFNLDRGYSANISFGIPEEYNSELLSIKTRGIDADFFNNAYYVNKNFRVITGPLLETKGIDSEKYFNLLSLCQAESDVNIIDCPSEQTEILKTAVMYSNLILVVFDMDSFHLKMNFKMLEDIKDLLNMRKTIAVINNTFNDSKELKNIRGLIENSCYEFKDICYVRNAGAAAYDAKYTNMSPYMISKDKNFKDDIDNLLRVMSAKEKKKTLLSRFFK